MAPIGVGKNSICLLFSYIKIRMEELIVNNTVGQGINDYNSFLDKLEINLTKAATNVNYYIEEQDTNRNRVNYGLVTAYSHILRELGYKIDIPCWEDNNYLRIEKVTLERPNTKNNILKEKEDLSENNLIKKGDIVKTGLSDTTLVLEVKENMALLFGNNQFVVANDFQKENGKVHWGHGNYYSDLPRDPFREIKYDDKEAEKIIMNIINNNYKTLVKTLMRTEHCYANEEILDEVYYRFLENDEELLSDWFEKQIEELENEDEDEWNLEM